MEYHTIRVVLETLYNLCELLRLSYINYPFGLYLFILVLLVSQYGWKIWGYAIAPCLRGVSRASLGALLKIRLVSGLGRSPRKGKLVQDIQSLV